MAKLNKTQLKALNTQNITQNGPSDSITASEIREVNDAIIDSYVHLDDPQFTAIENQYGTHPAFSTIQSAIEWILSQN